MRARLICNVLCLAAVTVMVCSCGEDDYPESDRPRASASDMAIAAAAAPLGIVGGVAAGLIVMEKDKHENATEAGEGTEYLKPGTAEAPATTEARATTQTRGHETSGGGKLAAEKKAVRQVGSGNEKAAVISTNRAGRKVATAPDGTQYLVQ